MKKFLFFKIILVLLLFGGKAQAQIDGTLDTSFAIGSGFNQAVMATAVQSDGKILVGGWFTYYKGTEQNHITRLNIDGSIDTSFNTGLGFSGIGNTYVDTITVQTDGKILIGGRFTSYNGVDQNLITRLNADGTMDSSFNIGSGFDVGSFNSVNSIAVQSDDKILIGGRFVSYNGKNQAAIARLNTNGTLDNFSAGFGSADMVESIAIQSDGKIIIAGAFTYNYILGKQNDIVRLNANGTHDPSFEIGTGFDGAPTNPIIQSIVLQPDGKVLVGGWFTTYKGLTQNRIARLNTNGSLDTSFAVGTGIENYSVGTIALQSDGKIVLGGNFISINGTSQRCISRLNHNGSVDTTFNIGAGFSGIITNIKAISIQSDGKIVAGGYFEKYQGVTQNRLARLTGATLSAHDIKIAKIDIYPNPVRDILNFSEVITSLKITEPSGKLVTEMFVNGTSIDIGKLRKGAYFVTFSNRNGESVTKKIVKN